MDVVLRPAHPSDARAIERIEIAADALLIERFGATDWPPPTSPDERALAPGFVLVAEATSAAGDKSDAQETNVPGHARATEETSVPRHTIDEVSAAIVGFVHVLLLEGHAHLEQVSVDPSHGRRGIGRRLVDAAKAEASARGFSHITLRTYADVPWNAPFYASCGFVPSDPDSPFLRSLIRTEEKLGLFRYGARVQMTAVL